jgi:hypothetical protein
VREIWGSGLYVEGRLYGFTEYNCNGYFPVWTPDGNLCENPTGVRLEPVAKIETTAIKVDLIMSTCVREKAVRPTAICFRSDGRLLDNCCNYYMLIV